MMLAGSESIDAHQVPRGHDPGDRTFSGLAGLLSQWADKLGDQAAITYWDYRGNPAGSAHSITWRQLETRVSAVAAAVAEAARPGDRAAILADQGPDYIVAFLGALRAGTVAVPLFRPNAFTQPHRLAALVEDADPSVVLTTWDAVDDVYEFLGVRQTPVHEVIAVDQVPDERGSGFTAPACDPDALAYLQYTSGSTRSPAGVMITHGNVIANAEHAAEAYGMTTGRTANVSWLPLFHDMGLMLGIGTPVFAGIPVVLMDPLAFIEQPVRWLRALSATPGAISAAPGFAYGLCAARVDARAKTMLQLDHVISLIDGSEPIRPDTVDRFRRAFAECGLPAHVHRPSYGLAEATVLVSVTPAGTPPTSAGFDRAELALGRAKAVAAGTPGAIDLVSCGRPVGQRVRIVDPVSLRESPAGEVGEIWVSGPNVGRGYWRRPELSAETFHARPADAGPDTGTWMRTGDLGVLADGDLYVTGRFKDLIIVDGRNHYPQDVEATVERAHPALRPHAVAAFAVPGVDGEDLVVVAEWARSVDLTTAPHADVARAVRRAVSAEHGIALADVLVLPAGGVPRTTSGKISRSRCRAEYAGGALRPEPTT